MHCGHLILIGRRLGIPSATPQPGHVMAWSTCARLSFAPAVGSYWKRNPSIEIFEADSEEMEPLCLPQVRTVVERLAAVDWQREGEQRSHRD